MFDYNPLDDKYRYCIYCNADCWPEKPKHTAECPDTTGLYPVDEDMLKHEAVCGAGITGNECRYEFQPGDFYMYVEEEQINDRDKMVVVACIGCALREKLEI